MHSVSQTPSSVVAQLLLAYRQDHPFVEKPEYTQEQGLRTEHYYQDAVTYSQACCEWVQQQMQEQGITIHLYRLSKGHILQDRSFYDLTVDNHVVLHDVPSLEVDDYVLCTMQNHDVYCEAHMTEPLSGQRLRESHNAMEARYAKDGTYTPQYSYGPGPYTSERQSETNDPSHIQEAVRELVEERGYRDATHLVRWWYEDHKREYSYLYTLQAPDGSPIYCRTANHVKNVLETARAKHETNASRTAPEPLDSPPWTLVGNFDIDDIGMRQREVEIQGQNEIVRQWNTFA